MKSLLVLLSVCVLPVQTSMPRRALTDWEREGLLGQVKEIVEKSDTTHTITTYDINGNVISAQHSAGCFHTKSRYKVDSNSLILCYQSHSSCDSMPPSLAPNPVLTGGCGETYNLQYQYEPIYTRTGNTFSKVGGILEVVSRSGPSLAWRVRSIYDAQGRVTEINYVNAKDLVLQKQLYAYVANSRAPEIYELQIDGKTVIREWYEYKYDSIGNWIHRKTIRSENVGVSTARERKRSITYY